MTVVFRVISLRYLFYVKAGEKVLQPFFKVKIKVLTGQFLNGNTLIKYPNVHTCISIRVVP